MKYWKKLMVCFAAAFIVGLCLQSAALAYDPPDPRTYVPTFMDIEKAKKFYEDPRSVYAGPLSIKNRLPKELYEKLVFPIEEMKKEWAEVVGFKAPDVVGKKAPEIKPGKYTYKDLEKYPAFKELFWPGMYKRIKAGGPPHAGNIPEFEIVPTIQYYHSLPVSRYTKENASKIKTDGKGYLVSPWEGGYPFPRPSGPNKAIQIMYNIEKRYFSWDGSFLYFSRIDGFRKDLSRDYSGSCIVRHLKLGGRLALEPYGWIDERARLRGELKTFAMDYASPRDAIGTAMSALYYLDPNKADLLMVYVPQLRRIRMLTSSDSQDPVQGQDQIYDDNEGFLQKISPTRFPYKWEVLEETEYLAPVFDGTEYITKKGLEVHNLKFMRRPIYVIQGTQLDTNYVYSKRIFYVDKELFMFYDIANYDQKGRLYRTFEGGFKFEQDMGVIHMGGVTAIMKDHVDVHSGIALTYQIPAFWKRKDVSLEQYLGAK
jgi:hypothetical protein